MPSEEEPAYKVTLVGPVKKQMRDLHRKATTLGKHQEVVDALKAVIGHLQTGPLGWGDPQHRTRRPGGTVFHGIHGPVIARYAVFEAEKVVFLLDVRAASSSFLMP
jgi:hypothetical protein